MLTTEYEKKEKAQKKLQIDHQFAIENRNTKALGK